MADRDVPFSVLLKVLEDEGYRLVRLRGSFRVFDPPSSRPGARRIGFEVKKRMVEYKHAQLVLKAIREDKKGRD